MSTPGLTVVFDDTCELCRRCHRWLAGQEAIIPLRFLAAGDPVAVEWLGDQLPIGQELVVVDHTGATWVGPDAFVAVLSVLRRYTDLARRLQQPALRPLARQAFHAVSAGRSSVSALLGDSEELCPDGSCTVSPAAGPTRDRA